MLRGWEDYEIVSTKCVIDIVYKWRTIRYVKRTQVALKRRALFFAGEAGAGGGDCGPYAATLAESDGCLPAFAGGTGASAVAEMENGRRVAAVLVGGI